MQKYYYTLHCNKQIQHMPKGKEGRNYYEEFR